MSADTLATGSINSFSGLAGQVQPEEQIFVLSGSQLQDLIGQAIEQAISPLEARIRVLEDLQFQDADRFSQDIASDRRRIARLENPGQETTETEKDRLARIEKCLREAPNHMITLAELRGRLGIGKQRLSMLLKKLDGERYYLKKSSQDKRVRYLCLRPVLDSSRRTITNFDI